MQLFPEVLAERKELGGFALGGKRGAQHALLSCLMFGMLILLLSSGSVGTFAQEQEPIIFLVNERLTPIAYEQNGVAKGVVVDIAKALGEKLGRRIEVRAMDWQEAQHLVLDGQAHALLQINRTPDREEIYSFSEPLLSSEFVIIRPQDETDIKGELDLEGKRVGVEIGGYAYDVLGGDDQIDRVAILSAAQGLEFLISGDLDAVIVDRWIGEYALAQTRSSGLVIARAPFAVNHSHIAVKRGNDELLKLINHGLQEIKNDGTFDRILQDWGGKNVIYLTEEQITRAAAATGMIILLVVSSISTFFVVKLKRLNQALEVKVADRTQELAVANRRLQTANAALEKQSKLDQLTQILNRRGFNAVYEKAWDICQRLQQPLSFIIIDVDNFKTVNDKLGHLTGDQFLEEIALLLQNAAGSSDVEVARLGGDEFVCVLQNAAEEEAAEFAETIRAEIGNLTFTNADWQLELSASLGVASLIPNETSSPKELFALADQALYKAKESGRNKMVKASDI